MSSAQAQKQESGLLDRIDHPDLTMKFDPADRHFGVISAVGNRQATVKAYSFGKQGSVFGGDGTFRTKAFSARSGDGMIKTYDAKTSSVSQHNSFAQADKGLGTKSMDVREAPAANKSATGTREFVPGEKGYEWHGKRQDSIDDIYKSNKNLSIDQVRDLLNKGPVGKP